MPFQVRLTWLNHAPVISVNIDVVTARRRVSGWAGEIATSCGAGSPELVIEQTRVFWRVPVVFTRQGFGVVGEIGSVDVDAQTGQMSVNEGMVHDMQAKAVQMASNLINSESHTPHA
jgi:hypothetical protein